VREKEWEIIVCEREHGGRGEYSGAVRDENVSDGERSVNGSSDRMGKS